jgi:protein involved in ribonucleotide reduction
MLDIVYFSNVTNNTARFIAKLEWGSSTRIPIKGEFEEDLPHSYVLFVPSYGTSDTGHIPPQVKKFLNKHENRKKCVGVIGTGNINFGEEYAMAGDVIAEKLGVPMLYRLELAGTEIDVIKVQEGLQQFEEYLSKKLFLQTLNK